MSWVTQLKNVVVEKGFIFYFVILFIFFVTKAWLSAKYATRDAERDHKMPTAMTWVNIGFIIVLALICGVMGWNFNNGIVKTYLVAGVLIGSLIYFEYMKKSPFVKVDVHMSYTPAVAMMFYIIANIIILATKSTVSGNVKSTMLMLTSLTLAIYGGATQLNNFGTMGSRVIEKNNARELSVGDYSGTFTTYGTLSMGDVVVVEVAIPFILALYLMEHYVGDNLGEKNTHILVVLVLAIFAAGMSRLIANIVKMFACKPRPCAARMAGCNLANNKVSCNGCKKCSRNVDTINCKKSCYYSDVTGSKKNLTPNCMCTGKWNSFDLERSDLGCENLWNRKMELYDVKYYKEDEKKQNSLVQAFQSMPSGHTVSAFYCLALVFAVYILGMRSKHYTFGWMFIAFMGLVAVYGVGVSVTRITDGWHSVLDCSAGASIAIGVVALIFVPFYTKFG